MKGIVKHKGKLYKRAKRPDIHKGSLIQLICKRTSSYFKYNGVYEVVREPYTLHDGRKSGAEIMIPKELTDGEYNIGIKCGYNIGHDEYYQLIEYKRPNKPIPVYEEQGPDSETASA